MSKKCCFRGCDFTNYNSSATFFSFPKETDHRYQAWLQLTKCDPEIKNKLVCSNHFDQNKYMSSNTRRKMLLNTAMPYQYVPETSETTTTVEEFNFSINTDQEDAENIFVTKTDFEISDEGDSLALVCKTLIAMKFQIIRGHIL